MWQLIRPYIRNVYRIYNGIVGFIYDISRLIRYGGWRGDMNDIELRNYNSMRVYHGLEKTLSYKYRDPNRGWKKAFEMLNILKISKTKKSNELGYHDKAAKQVLEKFINLPENINSEKALIIKRELKGMHFNSDEQHGAIGYTIDDFKNGTLNDPEKFFYSRYSLREFKDKIVSEEIIKRGLKLAMKTPSVCNRQAWSVYHTSDNKVKNTVLNYQTGNKPFGEKIPNIMIVTTDLKAFIGGSEHYQHWIDGGLLSMSLMYAFHSLGVATCALNWSQTPKRDKQLRSKVNIKPNHTIIMLLAIGYPDENNKVCVSARRPFYEVFRTLKNNK